jgi:hypothetical protein
MARIPRALERLRGEWAPVFVSSDRRMLLLAHVSEPEVSAQAGARWWIVTPERTASRKVGTCGHPYVREGQ